MEMHSIVSVSYTHLDVYKRQHIYDLADDLGTIMPDIISKQLQGRLYTYGIMQNTLKLQDVN